MMNRIEMTTQFHGLFSMMVCVEADVTDNEILDFCNTVNPSGTSNGWSSVVRNDAEHPRRNPIVCSEDESRLHIIVDC